MLSYSFEDNKSPIYEQLYNYIKKDIMSGELSANTKLPSKRSFAGQLSVSVITVENAYNQLMSEGFIYSLPKKGFYVSDIFSIGMSLPTDKNLYKENKINRSSRNEKVIYSKVSVPYYVNQNTFADFNSNSADPASFPFSTWAKITRRILSDDQNYLMQNSPSNGIIELRFAISDYLEAFRGMNVNPNNIIVGAGTEIMYNILIQLLGQSKVYASEIPGYDKIDRILKANSVISERIPLDEYGIIPEQLTEKSVDIIHITPSHHFPTGITMPIKRRYEILEWANIGLHNLKDKYIIEDDYDSEFRLSGLPIPSLYSIDNSERVIYMNTFTKSLASTIRISYMILPDHLMAKYNETLSFYACTVSTFEQLTLAHFIADGYYEKHINRMRSSSRRKRNLLLRCIRESSLGKIATINEEESGLHFILRLDLKRNEKTFLEKAKKQGINISPVSKNSYMINYSSIPMDRIEEAVNRLSFAAFD